jgi:hypothetical protein
VRHLVAIVLHEVVGSRVTLLARVRAEVERALRYAAETIVSNEDGAET